MYFELYGAVSPIVRIHGSGNQGLEVRVVFLTLIPNNPFVELQLPVLGILDSAGSEILVCKGRMFPLGDTTMVH